MLRKSHHSPFEVHESTHRDVTPRRLDLRHDRTIACRSRFLRECRSGFVCVRLRRRAQDRETGREPKQ